jgi:hypothetical protein
MSCVCALNSTGGQSQSRCCVTGLRCFPKCCATVLTVEILLLLVETTGTCFLERAVVGVFPATVLLATWGCSFINKEDGILF